MEARAVTLEEALNLPKADYYTIPKYQRPYAWTEENFKELWEDLNNAFCEYKKAKEMNNKPEYYFMGAVLFVLNNKTIEIIDGQQRITTFHIMLWYLSFKLSNKEKYRIEAILKFYQGEPKLKVSARDSDTFYQVTQNSDIITGNSNMEKSAAFFKEKMESLEDASEFANFIIDFINQFFIFYFLFYYYLNFINSCINAKKRGCRRKLTGKL